MSNKIFSWFLYLTTEMKQTITNTKSFFYVCSLFEGSILSSKIYNISLELVKKNAFFEKNEINFGNDRQTFLFWFIIRICGNCVRFAEIY